LSFGCPIIDEITGGIARGIVTEVCGEAGSGKTQICLKLAIQVSTTLVTRYICIRRNSLSKVEA
jgi:RecA/RadA recombinase